MTNHTQISKYPLVILLGISNGNKTRVTCNRTLYHTQHMCYRSRVRHGTLTSLFILLQLKPWFVVKV